MRIALFVTCLADACAPRTAIAAVRVLERLGHEVVFPSEQTCCGQALHTAGDEAGARTALVRLARVFGPYESVVTVSASCAAIVRHAGQPEHGASPTPDDVVLADLAAKTFEIVEWLSAKEELDPAALEAALSPALRVTVHHSCHQRGIDQTDEADRLLDRVSGISVNELEHPETCCGFGGVFATEYDAISAAMGRDKLDDARRTGAETLVCSDTGCRMHLSGLCNGEIPMVSAIELLAESMALMDDIPRE